MGRQIQFHMMPEDQDAFLRFIQESDPVVLIERDHPTDRDVQPVKDIANNRLGICCLWNRRFLPALEREYVPHARYYKYVVGTSRLPLLELSPSIRSEWEGKPALIQGRLYGEFEPHLRRPPTFENWYEKLVRWIRKNFKKNPAGWGGYVGPAAYQFHLEGGYLLPNFLPPRTDAWLAEIGKQHPPESPRKRVTAV